MLGLALIKGDESAIKLIEKTISTGFLVPEGSQASPKIWTESVIQNGQDLFGRGSSVLCPFLIPEKQMCGIHNYRNSVCSTFFCEVKHGPASEDFWSQLQSLMLQIETALAQWCMVELGFDIDRYFKTFDNWAVRLDQCSVKDGAWGVEIYDELWRDWSDSPREFFIKAGELVIQNKETLFEIAREFEIRQTKDFEKANYDAVPRKYHAERDREPFIDGNAVPVSQLWYEFQAQHKNLWRFPLGEKLRWDRELSLEENPKDESVADFYKNAPYQLRMGRRFYYLEDNQARGLMLLQSPKVLDSELIAKLENLNLPPRQIIAEWINKGWISTHSV